MKELCNGTKGLEVELSLRTDTEFFKSAETESIEHDKRAKLFLKNFCGIAYSGQIGFPPDFYDGAVEDITGFDQEEFSQGSPQWRNIVHEDDVAIYDSMMKQLQETHEYVSQIEYRIIHRSGRVRWVRNYSSNHCDASGKLACYGGAIYDITEQKEIEAGIAKMKNLESIGILAGGIAHDFNNLLMAITGYISLAKAKITDDDKAYQLLTEAENISFSGKDLTQQLITFSRGGEPSKRTIHLDSLLTNLIEPLLHGSNTVCKYDIPENLRPIEADEEQLRRAIRNIVTNAKESMPAGGQILVRAANRKIEEKNNVPLSKDDYIEISITDEGTGIPRDCLSKVFDPYFTTKPMGAQRGKGLGLAVVYSILKKHGGCVTVESETSRGTTFRLYFPAARDPISLKLVNKSFIRKNGRRILFMDEEEIVREVAGQIIQGIGYRPVLARHGVEAIEIYKHEKLQGSPFEVVILDLTVKNGMGGKEALEELFSIDPDIRAIVSSGYINDPVIARYKDYGFAGAITKPYKAKELKELIEKVVRQ